MPETDLNKIYDRMLYYMKNINRCRYGQAVFNAAYDLYPKQTDALRGTYADCFYDDKRIASFLYALRGKN